MTTQLHLYELSPAIKTLMELMEDSGEEGWDAALTELRGAFEEKAINLAKLVLTWRAEKEIYKTEIARLQAHATAAANKEAWARDYLERNMEESGISYINGDVVKIRLQNSPPSVYVPDYKDVPMQYLSGTVKLSWVEIRALGLEDRAEPVVNKQAILAEYKATGAEVQGVTIELKKHIRIY